MASVNTCFHSVKKTSEHLELVASELQQAK
jgi:hypothetical protein